MGSVDCWPLATTIVQTFGGKPKPVAACGRDRRTASSSLGAHVAVRGGLTARSTLRRTAPRGTQWGQSDGPAGASPSKSFGSGAASRGRARSHARPFLANYSAPLRGSPAPPPPRLGRRRGPRARRPKIVTWLILPVVICLSQRLSHACPSISDLYGETANGSLNQLSFI
jgi:hypothetical protein